VIRTLGLTEGFAEFVPSDTPAADAQTELGNPVGDLFPFASATIAELTGASADRYLDQYGKTPAECADIRVNGREQAAVVDRPLPGFGERSRYLTRTYPVPTGQWTDRILVYRGPTYVMDIRISGLSGTDAGFQAFARQVRDLVQAKLRTS
jgi:hypothetical protein